MAYQTIPPTTGGGGDPVGWEAERMAIAVDRVPTLNRCLGVEYINTGDFFLGGGANAPTLVTTISGGVYRSPAAAAAAAGWFSLGVGDDRKIVAAPASESWYVASWTRNPAGAAVTAGKFIIPIGIVTTDGAIYIECNQATSATVFQLDLVNAGGPHMQSLGAVATIGADTCPIGSWFVVSAYFSVVTGILTVEFSDTVAETFSGAELAEMPTGAASVISHYANDATLAMQGGGTFIAWTAP